MATATRVAEHPSPRPPGLERHPVLPSSRTPMPSRARVPRQPRPPRGACSPRLAWRNRPAPARSRGVTGGSLMATATRVAERPWPPAPSSSRRQAPLPLPCGTPRQRVAAPATAGARAATTTRILRLACARRRHASARRAGGLRAGDPNGSAAAGPGEDGSDTVSSRSLLSRRATPWRRSCVSPRSTRTIASAPTATVRSDALAAIGRGGPTGSVASAGPGSPSHLGSVPATWSVASTRS